MSSTTTFRRSSQPQRSGECATRPRGRCESRGLSTPAETPTRYVLCRDDRLFTPAWACRHARERRGIEADEMDGGHYVTSAALASWPTARRVSPVA